MIIRCGCVSALKLLLDSNDLALIHCFNFILLNLHSATSKRTSGAVCKPGLADHRLMDKPPDTEAKLGSRRYYFDIDVKVLSELSCAL